MKYKLLTVIAVMFALPASALEVNVTNNQARVGATLSSLQNSLETLRIQVEGQNNFISIVKDDLTAAKDKITVLESCSAAKKAFNAETGECGEVISAAEECNCPAMTITHTPANSDILNSNKYSYANRVKLATKYSTTATFNLPATTSCSQNYEETINVKTTGYYKVKVWMNAKKGPTKPASVTAICGKVAWSISNKVLP